MTRTRAKANLPGEHSLEDPGGRALAADAVEALPLPLPSPLAVPGAGDGGGDEGEDEEEGELHALGRFEGLGLAVFGDWCLGKGRPGLLYGAHVVRFGSATLPGIKGAFVGSR